MKKMLGISSHLSANFLGILIGGLIPSNIEWRQAEWCCKSCDDGKYVLVPIFYSIDFSLLLLTLQFNIIYYNNTVNFSTLLLSHRGITYQI